MQNQAKAERKSEREYVVSRTISGSSRIVYEAWSKPEIFRNWWVPEGAPMTLTTCEMDVRTGGRYRLVFNVGDQNMEFFGNYLEATPQTKIVWTNDEGGDEAAAITTVTFAEKGGKTLVTVHDLYPTKEALDEAIASGSTAGMPAQLAQLERLIVKK